MAIIRTPSLDRKLPNSRKKQRLYLVLAAMGALLAAVLLAMSGLKRQAAYFYSPSDVVKQSPPLDKMMRLGGMVKRGSLQQSSDGITTIFVVEDNEAAISVSFKGIAPALFKEGSGVIAEGSFVTPEQFVATNILAKHDERYMPPQMEGNMHKTSKVS